MDNYEPRNIDQQINDGFRALAPVEQAKMAEARGLVDGLADDEIKGLYADFERNAGEAHEVSATLMPELQKLRARLPTAYNQVQVLAEAQALEPRVAAEVNGRLDAATAAVQMMAPLLFARALPTLTDPQSRSEKIHEAEMLVANLSGPHLLNALAALAGGQDRQLAAICVGSWGKARLGGNKAAHDVVVRAAVQGSLNYGSESEKRHAAAYGTLPTTAMKALAVTRTRTRERLRGRPI